MNGTPFMVLVPFDLCKRYIVGAATRLSSHKLPYLLGRTIDHYPVDQRIMDIG